MSTVDEIKKDLAKVETGGLKEMIEQSSKELARALPDHMKPERLVRIALTCLRMNPELARCTPQSFMGALFTSAQLGLEPVNGRAYLLPFNNNRKINGEWKSFKEVQFIIGYRGLIDMFYRHGKAVMLTWGVVKEHDEFDYRKGTGAYLHHKPHSGERGENIGFWVMARLQNGGEPFEYMTLNDCMEHGRKHSKTYDKKKNEFYSSSPWVTTEEAMCLKTVLIQLSKLLPLSIEIQSALEADESSREIRKGIDNVLDIPSMTEWIEPSVPEETPKEETK